MLAELRRYRALDSKIIRAIGRTTRSKESIIQQCIGVARVYTLTDWGAKRLIRKRLRALRKMDVIQLHFNSGRFGVNMLNSTGPSILGIDPQDLSSEIDVSNKSIGMSTILALAMKLQKVDKQRH